MTLYETLSFHSPFYSEICVSKRNEHVRNKKRPELHDKEKRSPVLFQDLMSLCWSHEPRQRPVMSEVKRMADKVEFELLRAASHLRNITKKSITCACVSRTFPSTSAIASLVSHNNAIGGTVDSTVRQISECEHKEANDRRLLHNKQSDPETSVNKGEESSDSDSDEEEIMQFSSNEPLNDPSVQIWVFENVITEHKSESKAAFCTYQDGCTGCYRRSAVSSYLLTLVNVHVNYSLSIIILIEINLYVLLLL